jgi:hypothetical protein
VLIGSQRAGQYERVLSIVFDPGRKITITEAIELFWVNRVHRKVPRKKLLNQRPMWNLDANQR